MGSLFQRSVLAGVMTAWFCSGAMADVTADLSDLSTGAEQVWNGSDGSGGFASQAIRFGNEFTDWGGGFTSWAGFSYSRVNDPVTPGYGNQYAVISGTGVGGTGLYTVVYDDAPWGESDVITLPVPGAVKGFYVNNTTYAALVMRHGDGFSRRFCAASNDWFKVTITAQDSDGEATGATECYLADYRFTDTNQNYIVTNWTWVSLTNLGSKVKSLHFELSSSDNGVFGMNTPAYFALDSLTTLESYAPAAEEVGSTAMPMDTNAFIAWATGWTNYLVGSDCIPMFQTPNLATGPAVGDAFDIVCLGESGQITMTFGSPLQDGPGHDFAVFENAFSGSNFLEFAYTEVSSDGTNFTRFFNRSLTTNRINMAGAMIDPGNVTGLGSKYMQGFGEPYDLGALRGSPGLDVNNIRYVRFLDISGNGTCTDSVGHVIYDPYPGTGSAGFDLDAVGVLSNDFQEVFVEAIHPVASRNGPSNGLFRVTRKTWDTSSGLDVVLSLGGTASNGADYAWLTNTIHIAAGALTQDVEIVPFVEVPGEGDRTVILQLVSNAFYQVEPTGDRARMTLQDIPKVSVTTGSPVAAEAGDATGAVVISRNTVRSGEPLAVHLVLSGSAGVADYTGLTNIVVFPAGVLSTTLYVRALADTDIEGDEIVGVDLVPDDSYRTGDTTQAVITLRDLPLDAWRLSAASQSFDGLPLTAGDYWNGADGSGGFMINGVSFKNTFSDWGGGFTSWAGFSYSRVNDPVTPGYGNQYAVISGSGVGGTGTYVVAYDDGMWSESDIITLPTPARVLGFYINNTTYTALALRDGGGFSRRFCAASNDWFKVTITGQDAGGGTVGSVDFPLADYRFPDTNQNYIVTNWTWVSLAALGPNVKSLHFSLSSSDSGVYGMNTPSYFALDGFLVDPSSPAFEDTASWEGSGEANLMVYALGREAGDTSRPTLAPTNEASFFEVTYQRRVDLPDVGIGVEASTNLLDEASWTTNGIEERVVAEESGVATVRARISSGGAAAASFVRLRAWRK
jgi:hypothetical protein